MQLHLLGPSGGVETLALQDQVSKPLFSSNTVELQYDKISKMSYAPSKVSDQPGHCHTDSEDSDQTGQISVKAQLSQCLPQNI